MKLGIFVCFLARCSRQPDLSGEGTSRGARKRRRGPTVSCIPYAIPEISLAPDTKPEPEDEQDLINHTLLQFEIGMDEYVKCEQFMELEMLEYRCIDWKLIRRLGQLESVRTMFGPKWIGALACREP